MNLGEGKRGFFSVTLFCCGGVFPFSLYPVKIVPVHFITITSYPLAMLL